MAQCPVCQSEIQADFGLAECESCGAQLIVHVDGTVEHSSTNSDANSEPAEDSDELVDVSEDEVEEAAAEEYAAEEYPAEDAAAHEFAAELPAENAEPEVYRPPGTLDSPDLSDIAAFGNSDASSGREGALRYNLMIGGIDTADVREALREALTDRKFMWDTDQILRSIHNGEVVIPNVSATKAYMLISRLRSLPLKIKWEQYAIHQA